MSGTEIKVDMFKLSSESYDRFMRLRLQTGASDDQIMDALLKSLPDVSPETQRELFPNHYRPTMPERDEIISILQRGGFKDPAVIKGTDQSPVMTIVVTPTRKSNGAAMYIAEAMIKDLLKRSVMISARDGTFPFRFEMQL